MNRFGKRQAWALIVSFALSSAWFGYLFSLEAQQREQWAGNTWPSLGLACVVLGLLGCRPLYSAVAITAPAWVQLIASVFVVDSDDGLWAAAIVILGFWTLVAFGAAVLGSKVATRFAARRSSDA